jgi:hypothetical protein
VSQPEHRICFNLEEVLSMVGDLMMVAEDLRTHSVEDVNARSVDMVADQLLARTFDSN